VQRSLTKAAHHGRVGAVRLHYVIKYV